MRVKGEGVIGGGGKGREWKGNMREATVLAFILFCRLVPRLMSFLHNFGDFVTFCQLWRRSHSYGGRMLIYEAVVLNFIGLKWGGL